MSSEHLQEVREFQKAQVDATAQAALTATDHLAKLVEIQLEAGKELIKLLHSHSQRVLSTKDLAELGEANSGLVNTLLANSVQVSQDLFAAHNQYAKQAKEQVTNAVQQNVREAGDAGKAVQQAFAQGAQNLAQAGTSANNTAH